MAHLQEVFMHSLPLTLLVVKNMIDKSGNQRFSQDLYEFGWRDNICIIIAMLNVVQIISEIIIYNTFLLKGENLERRPTSKSQTRLEDLIRVTLVSLIICFVVMISSRYIFAREVCPFGQFNENNICKECKIEVDQSCIKCSERAACEECLHGIVPSKENDFTQSPGFYPIDNKCYKCQLRDDFGG